MEWLPVYDDIRVAVSADHRFGTDAILLSHFATPAPGETVCELGTGCGAIALRLAATGRPSAVHGVDIQPEAIGLAQAGAEAFPGTPRPTFAVGDWRNFREIAPAGSFRRVVCNPPYFPPDSGEKSREAAVRLARHEQLDTLDTLCGAASWLVQSGGSFCLCHRPERLAAVLAALTRHKLEPKRLQPVQKRGDTAPWLFLLEARRDGKPGLTWLPPLVLYTDTGEPSPAMREIYRELPPEKGDKNHA
ncbi:MAG: methyltransferase domain-containing protein [Clostridia bacterium]|nr:methyltransferase domain-containing protein [Clostridia bacterium]